MATIEGNLIEITGAPGVRRVMFSALTKPVIVGTGLVAPGETVKVADENGEFVVDLVMGDYKVTVGAMKVTIRVPDSSTVYELVDLIIADDLVDLSPYTTGVWFRVKNGKAQFKNLDTGKWHTGWMLGAAGGEYMVFGEGEE